jgi:hypothetical protein
MQRTVSSLAIALGALGLAACSSAPPVTATPSPQVEADVTSQATTAAPGAQMVGQLYRGVAMKKGEFSDFHVELESGKCYYFSGAGDDGVAQLGLYLWDPANHRTTSDRSKGHTSFIQYCATATGTFKVEEKVLAGAGHYAFAIYSKDAPPPPPKPEAPKEPTLEDMITDDANAEAPGATLQGDYLSADNGKTEWSLLLEKGKCYWFIGAGDKKIDDFYIYLWDPANKRIGESKASARKASYGHCPKEGGMFKVQVKTDTSKAVFKLGVFVKKAP